MKKLLFLFVLFYSTHSFCQEYYIVDNVIINAKDYQVLAKFNDNNFNIKIATKTENEESLGVVYDINVPTVQQILINLIKIKLDTTAELKDLDATTTKSILDKILKKKKDLRSITQTIDGEPMEYSGAITLIKKVKLTKAEKCYNIKEQNNLAKDDDTLNIDKAYINFFNNKASTIVIEGKINNTNEVVVIINDQFSIPLRYFNKHGSTNSFRAANNCYKIDYNDVFKMGANQHFNYSIANTELHFTKNNTLQQLPQRSFFDFFTAVLYTDVMAFDHKNSNSLINAQAKLLLPINQRNFSSAPKWTILRQVVTEVNIALYNGSTDNFRTIQTKTETEGTETVYTKFNHFDLLTKNNMNGNLALDILSHEAKGFFSYISLGYTSSFYRTSFKSTIINSGNNEAEAKDLEETASLFSLSHGPYLNIEVRPQTNFGADIGVAFSNLTYNGSETIADVNIREIISFNGNNQFGFKYNIVHLKADFYWLNNAKKSKKDGVFARIGGLYHTESKEIYPQLMVGYATNLTSFVNRFSPKAETK